MNGVKRLGFVKPNPPKGLWSAQSNLPQDDCIPSVIILEFVPQGRGTTPGQEFKNLSGPQTFFFFGSKELSLNDVISSITPI